MSILIRLLLYVVHTMHNRSRQGSDCKSFLFLDYPAPSHLLTQCPILLDSIGNLLLEGGIGRPALLLPEYLS
jgi:hypothetical protein